MGFWDWLFGKKKGPAPAVLFDSDVKKLDIRNGAFVWLLNKETGKEFCGNFGIKKVIIDLPDAELAKKVDTRTMDGLVRLPLRDILENLGNRRGYFKFVHLKRTIHVKVYGVPNGDVVLTFSRPRFKKRLGLVGTDISNGKEPEKEESEA
jgi:hypothetical protein